MIRKDSITPHNIIYYFEIKTKINIGEKIDYELTLLAATRKICIFRIKVLSRYDYFWEIPNSQKLIKLNDLK